ncbi:PepSY-associated TM helix domain-containing protein [Sediminibacterium soli]|uniref:PepSY-associated TM helix domain-containing protein n=1 Tax=Sediminibacterium soli TaxID=2698829 RepID=UPI00137AC660|nr:PepSY-associated TM helix domain-containing protein [Sediminibacterium soli]NCI45058.1 PepSY domain-containing protein [Sediminibacterium soli]
MTLKQLSGRIHLWLGLSTGLIIFIIAITGALYCFAPELQDLQPYRHVAERNASFLPPSVLKQTAEQQVPGKFVLRIYYLEKDKSAMVFLFKKEEYSYSVFIDPYSGQVLKVRDNDRDPISVILKIHRTLLIPYGHDVIKWSAVIFFFMIVSGMVLWWPRNRGARKQGFTIQWNASAKRLNYDLHKVLGFYASWLVILTVITGLFFAFEGFAGFAYRLAGSGRSVVHPKPPVSDTTHVLSATAAEDIVWNKLSNQLHARYASFIFVFPANKTAPLLVRANPDRKTLYKTDFLFFDSYSGKEIPGSYVWGNYSDTKTFADIIKRTNYDVHTGILWGLPGRIALFFAALVVASLPITGFLFWWGRTKKAKE